jgi:Trehalase-like, N-terminal
VSDHGLDLAVIRNGRTAALVDPSSRMVWWCFPRFDSDPVFCRLLAGNEEKGFADAVLDGCVEGDLQTVCREFLDRTKATG